MRKQMIETVETVAGNISAPVYAYIGESGSGKDRRIKLEGATTFDKLLNLYKAGTYVSIGPAEGSAAWNKLDKEDQSDYRILQARAKKRTTYKQMGEFLADICAANECFLFAIRQGEDAVWVNPKALKELLDTEWRGTDKYWIEDACGVWDYHEKEFLKWKKRFGQKESLKKESLKKEPRKKNERGDSSEDVSGPVYLRLADSTTFDLDFDTWGSSATGYCTLGHPTLTKAVEKGIDPKLWAAVKDNIDWDSLDECIYDSDLEIGDLDGYTWESPSQYFEDPGDGGWKVTVDLGQNPVSAATDTILYTLGEEILVALSGDADYMSYSEDDEESLLAKAKEDPEIQTALGDLGLDFKVIEDLFELTNGDVGQEIYHEIMGWDGYEDEN